MKKIEQKKKRFAARLKITKGINCSESPTPNIILCNVGQATGFDNEMIVSLIQKMEPKVCIPKYVALNGESYSLLLFDGVNSAKCFYSKYKGLIKLNDSATPIYMLFMENETVPSMESVCKTNIPEGLLLLKNFITEKEETTLISLFDWQNSSESNLKNRQVKHYGYEFRYGSNDIDLNAPLSERIPLECNLLWSRLASYGIEFDSKPDQLTVNKYLPGQGIPSHVDKHSPFGETILSLSLGSPVIMDWKHHSGLYYPLMVPSRSMLVMTKNARYDWQHGIASRTWDYTIESITVDGRECKKIHYNDTVQRSTRLSLTFRWTRTGACSCSFKTLCDSSLQSTDDIENGLASNLEDIHVHQVYEKIACHFSTTRHKAWPKVVEFMSGIPAGSVVLDLGCGNGKNILRRTDILQIGGERSSGLLEECKNLISNISSADCLRLDLLEVAMRDECADYIICIAVIHHFSSKTRRMKAINTISRLLKKGGEALITVWAMDQTKSNYLSKSKVNDDSSNKSHTTVGGLNLPVHENRTQFQHNDLLVPWKLRRNNEKETQDTLLRYYHVFKESELDELCMSNENLQVTSSFYEEGNWCAICKKT